MTPDCRDASDAHEWLRRARSNFARAAAGPAHPDILLEVKCHRLSIGFHGDVNWPTAAPPARSVIAIRLIRAGVDLVDTIRYRSATVSAR